MQFKQGIYEKQQEYIVSKTKMKRIEHENREKADDINVNPGNYGCLGNSNAGMQI